MVTLILSIVFGILAIFFAVTTFYSLRRINTYEDLLVEISDKTDFINNQLKQIDHKGTFESDDEVGFFFTELKELNSILNNIFDTEVDDANKEEEKKEK
tara:strand:+ start:88 stop:384 length:297 start_codon:yes stop_codon:yes gene_type:complete